MLDKLREHGIEIILTLIILFLTFHTHASHDWTQQSPYNFPVFQKDIITMDVVKNDGVRGGGTYRCTSIYKCYMYTMAAEQRGATESCKTITIKKNGRKVWFKRYN